MTSEITTSIPASGALSNPVQRIMPVNEFIIAVVLQKIHAVLDDDGGNQAAHRIADRYSLPPQLAVNRRAKLECGAVVFQIGQVFKLLLGGNQLLSLANALQNFKKDKTAVTNIVVILKALFELGGLRRFASVEKINADRGINQDFHAKR